MNTHIGRKAVAMLAIVAASALALSGCAGAGAGSTSSKTINVLMVGNPQMEDIAKLTPSTFTKDTGIKVKFTVLSEDQERDKATQDIATKAGQYDVVMTSSYETSTWAKNGWLQALDSRAKSDASYDESDLIPAVLDTLKQDNKLYAVPFYGETSMMMYRKDLFQKAGITMPEHSTWDQIASYAAKLNDPSTGTSGICLRGAAGWGENFATFSTVLNTFGGTFFDKNWNAELQSDASQKAANFYVNLVKNYGEAGAAQSSYPECLNLFQQGKTAMWYDSSAAANQVKDPDASKVANDVGYAYAPVEKTKYSGWLSAWAWAMPVTSTNQDNAWKFMAWASGKKYETIAGEKLGWTNVPDGKRKSTYSIPQYQKASEGNYQIVLKSLETADPSNPGTQPRPYKGVNYVGIPEWQDLGTKMSQQFSAAIAGSQSVDSALTKEQQLAEVVGKKYQNK